MTNPRYTGRQVWNRQRKDEVLIDVEDVGLGHEIKMRWNSRDKWIFSEQIVHEPIIDVETFQRAQELAAAKMIEECDRALGRHRAALEAGADAALVAGWITETQARRAEAKARIVTQPQRQRLTKEQISDLVERLGDIRTVLTTADTERKAEVYRQLQLHVTHHPGKRLVRIETNLDAHSWGHGKCPRIELIHNPTLKFAADLQLL